MTSITQVESKLIRAERAMERGDYQRAHMILKQVSEDIDKIRGDLAVKLAGMEVIK